VLEFVVRCGPMAGLERDGRMFYVKFPPTGKHLKLQSKEDQHAAKKVRDLNFSMTFHGFAVYIGLFCCPLCWESGTRGSNSSNFIVTICEQ